MATVILGGGVLDEPPGVLETFHMHTLQSRIPTMQVICNFRIITHKNAGCILDMLHSICKSI